MIKRLIKEHPLISSVICTLVVGTLGFLIYAVIYNTSVGVPISKDDVAPTILMATAFSACIFYPFVLLGLELVFLILAVANKEYSSAWQFDQAALWYGAFLETVYLGMIGVTGSDWMVQLENEETHTPIYSGSWLTIIVIALLAIAGYYYLTFSPMSKMPPLMAVLSISAMYLGIAELVLLTVQVFFVAEHSAEYMLLLWPVCIVLMSARTVLVKVQEWKVLPMEKRKIHQNKYLNTMDHILSKASLWPVWGLVLAIPLLGILIAILMLFGQAPDSVIKAWTETADWRLSTKEAPQNIYYDEHYLCTVAAGGHPKIVKPIRRGIRHGHPVIVNRQLCVANAFEQVLEERTPRFHKAVRNFYDRFGFPIAKLIRKRWIADLVYFLMKPLEWIFVIVLYLTDVHPENRITVQYMGKTTQSYNDYLS